MDEIISYKMCAVKVRNAKLRNYLKAHKRSLGLHNYFELVAKNIFYERHSDIGKILMPWRTCANQFMLFLKWAQVAVCSHSPDPQTYTYIIKYTTQ